MTQNSIQTSSVEFSAELMTGIRIGPFTVRPRQERSNGPNGALYLEPKVMQVQVARAIELEPDSARAHPALAGMWMNQNDKAGRTQHVEG